LGHWYDTEFEPKDFIEASKKKRMKGGFNLTYRSQYELIMERVINSNKEMRLFNWITNQFTKSKVEAYVTHSACKKDGIEISKGQFAKMLKVLVEEQYLMRVHRGIYRLNPFVYLPVMSDAQLLQSEWKMKLTEY
jgi:hypothetical protein